MLSVLLRPQPRFAGAHDAAQHPSSSGNGETSFKTSRRGGGLLGWHNWPRMYSSLREEASEYETAAYHDDDGGGNDGDTFADEVMRCGDERTLWAAVLDRGRPLRQQEFKAISSQTRATLCDRAAPSL